MTTAEPRRIEFDLAPKTYEPPKRPYVPPSLRGVRHFTFDNSKSAQEVASEFGLFWIRILRGCVIGINQFGQPGDEFQLPAATCMMLALADPPQAEFIKDAKVLEEEADLERVRARGYTVEKGPVKKLAERPEYQSLLESKKKKKWSPFAHDD